MVYLNLLKYVISYGNITSDLRLFFLFMPIFSGRQLRRKRRVGCVCGHTDLSSLCEYEPARTVAILFSSPKKYLLHEMSERVSSVRISFRIRPRQTAVATAADFKHQNFGVCTTFYRHQPYLCIRGF